MPRSLKSLALVSVASATMLSGCTAGSTVFRSSSDVNGLSAARAAGSGVPSLVDPALQSLLHARGAGAPHAFMAPDLSTSTPIVYVSQHDNNAIQIYKQKGTNQSPAGALTVGLNGPEGLFVTSQHLLYVANTGANNILVFKRGVLSPILILNDPNESPVDVGVGPDGTVYASNVLDKFGRPGSVTVWAPGSTNPTGTLVVPNNSRVLFCAINRLNDLFVNYIDKASRHGALVEFKNGGGGALPTAITSAFPGGIEFDQFGHLAQADQRLMSISGFTVPQGKLIYTFVGTGVPLALALTKTRQFLYVSDSINGAVYQYVYPTGTIVNTITKGLGAAFGATGVATDPSAPQ